MLLRRKIISFLRFEFVERRSYWYYLLPVRSVVVLGDAHDPSPT